VLVGPPGSKRKEIALTLADALSEEGNPITCISVGDLINKEVTKHSDFGIEIE
jgi:adenylate kinase family enzyme